MIVVLQIIVYIIIGLVIYVLISVSSKEQMIKDIEESNGIDQEFAESALFYTIVLLYPILIVARIFSLISKVMIKYFGRRKE